MASYLDISTPAFFKMLRSLRKRGFPNTLPNFALYDRKAVDLWFDRISGITLDGRYNFHSTEQLAIGSKFAPVRQTTTIPVAKRSKNPYTVAEAVHHYLAWFREHHANATNVTYKCNSLILPYFGHRKVEELTPPQIRAWHEAIANSPRYRNTPFGERRRYYDPPQTDEEKRKRRVTANGDLSLLKAVLNFAFREGRVTTDAPWRAVQKFRSVQPIKVTRLTVEQCQHLLTYMEPDFRALTCGALLTGARLMELTRLHVDDFDPSAGTIHFAPGKTKWARHVVLSEEGRQFFKECVHNKLPNDLIFRRHDGQRWKAADPCHRLRVPSREAGLGHIMFHVFRHTYASLLAENGTNMAVIAKNLGHRRTEVTERYYSHLSETYVAREIRARLPKFDFTMVADVIEGEPPARLNNRDVVTGRFTRRDD